jgi:ATP-dependent protease ClpP protease subunit
MNQENHSNIEQQLKQQDLIQKTGELTLENSSFPQKIHLMTIIGEIEGQESLGSHSKSTKYEHLLPQLVDLEDSQDTDGLLLLLNTTGGDIDAGLSLAEMIASLSKPSVSLVLGGSHSIGVPLAVSTSYSFIVPTGTMLIHPVRSNGLILGVPQTFEYFKKIQDRITGFISRQTHVTVTRLEELMLNTGELTKDLGTILTGQEAVDEGLIQEVGGIHQALQKLHELIRSQHKKMQTIYNIKKI